MASLTVTVTVTVTVLLFTLAISVATSKPGNDIIDEPLTTVSAEPDPDSTKPTLPGPDEVTVPLNFVNFHPINRHFPRRPLTTTAPFKRRPCHELWGRRGLQISYGTDMIFSGEDEKAAGTDAVVADFPAIKILVVSFASEEDDDSKTITVKLVKRKEEDERGYYNGMFKRKIRKFLNHLV
ncbi:hypothetical protein CARUB_v10007610mg [Capsella rubella]|uniref:Uncharacterized protein n=1 Tax=Capsella rubella TaxID=81985 RepID=R0FAD6_9BRAS|nr:uncharacterized protein LOC17880603 [Capsella rubella]EOA18972.1 hypothetical protein CARUB_v10007610mg [Capsella rubella]